MPGRTMTLSFPPFGGFVRAMVLACTGIYFLELLLGWLQPLLAAEFFTAFWLLPVAVMKGWVWQLLTYSFLHDQHSVTHILFNMLSLWFVGSYLQAAVGSRKVGEIYFVSVIGAALCTVALGYTRILGLNPATPSVGASGGIFGLMVAFAVLFGDQEFMLFPLPFQIKAKWLVTIYILIAVAMLLGGGSGINYVAHLGGALFGYLYIKLAPTRGVGFRASEMYFGVRNQYYRWKRQRAQKKFQVYMKKRDDKPTSKPNGHA
jgi:membrane associated rhomboid family serine protease